MLPRLIGYDAEQAQGVGMIRLMSENLAADALGLRHPPVPVVLNGNAK